MANSLGLNVYETYSSVEDFRWRKSARGVSHGQNGVIVVDADIKAEGAHRVGKYLRSGVPVYRDGDVFKIFNATAKGAGKKVAGFVDSVLTLQTPDGQWFDEVEGGIMTYGGVYAVWLPIEVEEADLSPGANFEIVPKNS